MTRQRNPLDGVAAPRGSQGLTGDASSVDAVCCRNCTTDPQTPSSWKAHVVDLLSEAVELDPARAIAWAHIIQARFPWFRGA
jgi:hypothetical protein